MRAEAEAEKRDETRNIYINNKHNKCENCTKIATTLSGGCPRSQLRRRLERACALSALSPALSPVSLCGELGCCLRWVMAHESKMLNSTDRNVASQRCSCSRRWRHAAASLHELPQLPTAQSVQLFQLAIRNSPIRELPITWPWFCKQAGRRRCVGLQPNWHRATPAMAICLARLAHMATPAANKLSIYRAIDYRRVLCGTCHIASFAQLARYRSIDLSTYQFIDLSIYRLAF